MRSELKNLEYLLYRKLATYYFLPRNSLRFFRNPHFLSHVIEVALESTHAPPGGSHS